MNSPRPTWILTLFLVSGELTPAAGAAPGEFRWRTDLEVARRDALAAGKPFLVVFR
jgi:hypothetical protein